MRRERFFAMSRGEALALLAEAQVAHLATTTPAGAPLIRTLHPLVIGGDVCFVAAAVGEKAESLGRAAVLSAEELVATIPGCFVDDWPAATLYRSVQVQGTLEEADAGPDGERMLRVRATDVDGTAKLAQNRSPEERARLLDKLWERGLDGDARAIELLRAANPDTPTPPFLRTALPVTMHCALDARDIDAAVELLAPEYWNDVHPRERIAAAIAGSNVFVGARVDGKLVACARAISDGHKYAWVYDVVVARQWRGAGLGEAVMRLCLDHPRVRRAARVLLQTRDAQPLYRKLGFIEEAEAPPRPYRSTGMLRIQR